MAFVRKQNQTTPVPVELEDLAAPEDLIRLAQTKGIETSPLNVTELASHLGITVRFEPMPDDDSGKLFKDKKTKKWVMLVNALHHPHRQRFTIAHEIAHRIKHAANQDTFEDKEFFRNGESNWMEIEANQFAANLLMPEAVFNQKVNEGSVLVEELARFFQVSSMAVRIRAKTLGYSGHNL